MSQKRRIGNLRRTLNVEALEDRTLLAGAMFFTQDPLGVIVGTVFGKDTSHQYSLNQDNYLGVPTLTVAGQNGTFIAGRRHFDLSTVTGTNIKDGDGTNIIQLGNINGFTVPGNIIIKVDSAGTGGMFPAGPPGTGQDKVTTLNVNVASGTFMFSAAPGSQDTVSNTNDEFGAALITTGDATVTQTNVTVGTDVITTGDGTDDISVEHSRVGPAPRAPAIGLLRISTGTGTHKIEVDDDTLTRLGIFAQSSKTSTNDIKFTNSTYLAATIKAGTETTGDFSTSTINVTNDINTYNVDDGPVTALDVEALNAAGLSGTGADNNVNISQDSFVGGNVYVQIDSGTPVAYSKGFTHGYQLTMILDQEIGDLTIKGGDHAADVELGDMAHVVGVNDVDAESESLHIGTDVGLVRNTSEVSGHEDVIIGDVSTDSSVAGVAGVLINGNVGLGETDTDHDLFIMVGSNANTSLPGGWPLKVTETVGGGLGILAGSGDAVNVDPTNIGGLMDITMGNGGVNSSEALTLLGVMSTDPQILIESNPGDIVNINFTDVAITDPSGILFMQDKGLGVDIVNMSNVAVAGQLTVTLSQSGLNILTAHAVTAAFGTIDGGTPFGNTYNGALDPTNHGYFIIDFQFINP